MTNSTLVAQVRSRMRRLASNRNTGTVTADDVHSFLNTLNRPFSSRQRLSVVRSVLREPTFTPVGSVSSSRSRARGRTITEWSR